MRKKMSRLMPARKTQVRIETCLAALDTTQLLTEPPAQWLTEDAPTQNSTCQLTTNLNSFHKTGAHTKERHKGKSALHVPSLLKTMENSVPQPQIETEDEKGRILPLRVLVSDPLHPAAALLHKDTRHFAATGQSCLRNSSSKLTLLDEIQERVSLPSSSERVSFRSTGLLGAFL